MKCADLPRRLFQVLPIASHRRPRRHRPAFESFEDKLLLSAFYVAPSGSNSADGSSLHPWATIQHAADAVAPGDTVHVAPGTYTGAVSNSKSGTASARITFVSDVPHGAVINTTGTGASMIFYNTGDYVTIQGFDMSSSDHACSEGIENDGSYVWIIGNHVHDIPETNFVTSSQGGAGIASGNYAPWGGLAPGTTTQGNQIIGNEVNNIGPQARSSLVQGIYVRDANSVVSNNISDNNCGAGIELWHGANAVTISNNLVFMNFDGGIAVGSGDLDTPVPCNNCVVSNNIAINNPNAYGIFEEGNTGPNDVYLNNNVYGNGYAGISVRTGHTPTGTVTANARFVNYQSDGTGDYHLTAGSPDIVAGTSLGAPATDYAGVARSQGAGVDIGPYEYQTGSDTTPPTVTSESPASKATAVPISTTATIWGSTATPAVPAGADSKAVELGVKFRSDVNGYITGVRYYKGSGSTGTHVGHLWTSTGTLLATATFSNETASGWQQVNFATPVAITAGTTYVASYYAPAGHYAYDYNYFASSGVDNRVLHAPSKLAGAHPPDPSGSALEEPLADCNFYHYLLIPQSQILVVS